MSDANLGETNTVRRSLPEYLRHHFTDTQRYLIIWIITGLACGLAAVAFHKSIDLVFHLVSAGASWLGEGNTFLVYILLGVGPVIGGLLTGLILVYGEPAAGGSGIPRTKAQYYRNFGVIRLREAFYRFIVGTISVGFGMSLGREGPTVHICSAIASKIGQVFGLAKKRVQAMVPLGMGAGISAAFNTPMAAVFFVFEELLGDFSSKSFFGIFVCVVIAAAVQRILIGEHPAFDIELGIISTDWWMLLAIPLGLLSALFGHAFVEGILYSRQFFRDQAHLPEWVRPGIGGLGVGVVGVAVAFFSDGNLGIFGIGYTDLDAALNGRMTVITIIAMLFFGKIIASVLAYGSGGSGGLFAPTLFIGGMLGALLGLFAQPILNFENEIVGAMALLGMGAFFAAVIRCPMTSIVIIWEMTGQYGLILPLMVGNMLAWLIASKLQPVPLYDALLLQDKINLKKMPHYVGDQDWRNLPVSTIMTFDPVSLGSDLFPANSLSKIETEGLRHHAYPIIDPSGKLTGMITHHELEEHHRAGKEIPLGELITGQTLVRLRPETSIRDVAQVLVMEDVLQAPVVSSKDDTKLIGIVTLHDIARQQNAIDDSLGR
ncbi:chloride channel protein [Puniceicoccales bacterium CK1056]|uniref:Chloride channel protein n=1 Tax=Oceanipulchritudo coccoides TaxID=2706888 RepID=A0A6B2LYD0_9BACT|nr:chloride channel protein [Oceanipulchritudo coccoides]NDV61132.1 chloride channel protein [Oceanipulchritudo coccoides]